MLNLKKNRFLIFSIILLATILIGLVVFWNGDGVLLWNFKGPIESATYNEDGISSVTVKGKKYDLAGIEWGEGCKDVGKGDTAIKLKGDRYIKFIKANSKDTLYYNKEY